jgi:hypothetical protein
LFDGFGAYRTPTRGDFAGVLARGMVVPDANVLLNLYRYTDRAREDLMGVLRALGERLWVPRQVVEEFWRNREGVIGDARGIGERAAGEMEGHCAAAVRTLRAWGNRVALGEEDLRGLEEELAGAFGRVRARIAEVGAGERGGVGHDTGVDPVVRGLEEVLAGRVGEGFGADEAEGLAEVGRGRVARRVPPGYMDAQKEGDGALGDFFVWEQILRAAAGSGSDVLFVTADAKEDWWRKERGANRGPRPELAEELRARGGGRLFMLSPRRFLEEAAAILRVSLRDGSVADVERVERMAEGPSYGGWNAAALDALFQGLAAEGYGDRADVIRAAAAAGDGRIGAADVHELCGDEDGRGLRGFTRPVREVSGDLVDRGVIPDSAVRVLSTEYEDGPGRASGFRVHPLLVPLLRERAGDDE